MKDQDIASISNPIFTGDYRRDTVVSELEKAAEASQAIFTLINNKRKEGK